MVCAKILKKYCVLHKLEMWNRNCLYKVSFCKFHGLQGRPWFGHITTLQNGPLYF